MKRYALFMGMENDASDDAGGWDDWAMSSDTLSTLVSYANEKIPTPALSMQWWEVVDLVEEKIVAASNIVADQVLFYGTGKMLKVDPEGNEVMERDFHDTRWNDNQLQFCRLIAEMNSSLTTKGLGEIIDSLADAMDLTKKEVAEIIGRAQTQWDEYLEDLALESEPELAADEIKVPLKDSDINAMTTWSGMSEYTKFKVAAQTAKQNGVSYIIVKKSNAKQVAKSLKGYTTYNDIVAAVNHALNEDEKMPEPVVEIDKHLTQPMHQHLVNIHMPKEDLLVLAGFVGDPLKNSFAHNVQYTIDAGTTYINCYLEKAIDAYKELALNQYVPASLLALFEKSLAAHATKWSKESYIIPEVTPVVIPEVDPDLEALLAEEEAIQAGLHNKQYELVLKNCITKISCIKVVRQITGLGLKEAKDLVESAPCVVTSGSYKEMQTFVAKFPVDAILEVNVATDTHVMKEAEPTGYVLYSVVLEGYLTGQVIKCIKGVRSVTDLSLKEAKDLVESATLKNSAYVLNGVSFKVAEHAREVLINHGGLAFIRPAKKTVKVGS
jgi:ribosomal protein L7/L12